MVSAACIAITAVHPGFVLGKTWSQKKARAELAVRAGGVGMVGRRVGGVEKVEVMGSDEELKR